MFVVSLCKGRRVLLYFEFTSFYCCAFHHIENALHFKCQSIRLNIPSKSWKWSFDGCRLSTSTLIDCVIINQIIYWFPVIISLLACCWTYCIAPTLYAFKFAEILPKTSLYKYYLGHLFFFLYQRENKCCSMPKIKKTIIASLAPSYVMNLIGNIMCKDLCKFR